MLIAAVSWGSGGFTVQQRGALSLSFVALGASAAVTALAVTGGGSLSLSSMAVHAEVMVDMLWNLDGVGSKQSGQGNKLTAIVSHACNCIAALSAATPDVAVLLYCT